MINTKPQLPQRKFTPYRAETPSEISAAALQTHNPFAQKSVSALRDFDTCRRTGLLKNIVVLQPPQHPKAAAGEALHREIENWILHEKPPGHPSVAYAVERCYIAR